MAVNRAKFSFPVGKVDMKTLYPMDMEEFMLAMGEDALVRQIKKYFETDTPMPSAFHDRQCSSTGSILLSVVCRNV